jgi:hypothetical protein
LQAAFRQQVDQVVLNLLGAELVGRDAVVFGQAGDDSKVVFVCQRREAAQLQFPNHPVA